MITQVLSPDKHPFEWIDISDPDIEDFSALKEKYNLNAESIRDCLEIGHLPKIEEFDNYHFLIIRTTKAKLSDTSDSLIDITDRVSIFYGANFVITAHRNEIPFLENIKQDGCAQQNIIFQQTPHQYPSLRSLKNFRNIGIGRFGRQARRIRRDRLSASATQTLSQKTLLYQKADRRHPFGTYPL